MKKVLFIAALFASTSVFAHNHESTKDQGIEKPTEHQGGEHHKGKKHYGKKH